METIKSNELEFAKVSPDQLFELKKLVEVNGLLIEYTNQADVLALIKSIRSHEREAVSLIPIFLYKFHRESNQDIARFADGIVRDLSDLSAATDTAKIIQEHLNPNMTR